MHIPERIETLNTRLIDHFGKFENGDPNFRIVFSDDQVEKQLSEYTESGILLITPQLRTVKKYPWIKSKYLIERLVPVPEANAHELTTKLSYEPVWVFQDHNSNPLPPLWDVCKIVLDTLIRQMTTKRAPDKQDPSEYNTIEALEEKAKVLEKSLYGNESSITDALATGSAVGYGTYRRNDTRFNNNVIRGI